MPAEAPSVAAARDIEASGSDARSDARPDAQPDVHYFDPRLTPLSGYLYSKSVMHESLEGSQADALRELQWSMADTRAAYSKKRGNVLADVLETNFDSTARTTSALFIRDRLVEVLKAPEEARHAHLRHCIPFGTLRRLADDDSDKYASLAIAMMDAALGTLVQAGVSDMMSASLMDRHAALGKNGQRLELVGSNTSFPDNWFRLKQAGHEDASGNTWLDDESPMLVADTARGASDRHIMTELSLTPDEARSFHDGVGFMLAQLKSNAGLVSEQKNKAAERNAHYRRHANDQDWKYTLDFYPRKVAGRAADPSFIERARVAQEILEGTRRPALFNDIHAAGVARTSLDQGVHGATRPETLAIVKQAGRRFVAK